MSRIKGLTFHVAKSDFRDLRERLLTILTHAGYEPFTGLIQWRINDTLDEKSKVTVVAYKTGTLVISGHGYKFDLTTSFVKTYDVDRAKK